MRTAFLTFVLLLVGSTVFAQIPTYPVGRPLTLVWDARPAEENIVRYETRLGSGNLVDVGLQLSWLMPQDQLTVGEHTVSVRACNLEVSSQQIQCGPEGSITFRIAVPTSLPGAPVPRIVPQDLVLNGQQIRTLADSFSYVLRLQMLNGQELNALQAAYDGPLPITYLSEVSFLQRMALAIVLMP